ncbi:GpE family phage tail protein [Brevundimonas diminuta]|uniref:GpE family phage tail protein n=1 Tax=Brevundimonas diminuta TaxID=293 RepID=UPI0039905AC1
MHGHGRRGHRRPVGQGGQFFADEASEGGRWTRSVDDAFADIAAVFHWPLSAMSDLPLSDLMRWRDLAVARWNAMHAPPET